METLSGLGLRDCLRRISKNREVTIMTKREVSATGNRMSCSDNDFLLCLQSVIDLGNRTVQKHSCLGPILLLAPGQQAGNPMVRGWTTYS